MKIGLLSLLALFACAFACRADEKIAVFNTGSVVYTNVTVFSVSTTDVYFNYAGGMGNVKLKNLSPEWQKHFKFDPDKAHAAEVKQAQEKVKYHDDLVHQPVAHPPNEDRAAAAKPVAPREAVWRTDLPGAMTQAQSDGKRVLLDFTGSDWCPWCIKFDHDVLSTDQFATYAAARLVLVRLNFPHNTPQDPDLKQANAVLSEKFNVDGFPTYILLGADGHELGRQTGYLEGGPAAFLAELDGFDKH